MSPTRAWIRHGLLTTLILGGGLAIALGAWTCVSIDRQLDQRRQLYWYDHTLDYRYSFTGPEVTTIPLELEADGFTLPATLPSGSEGGTAFLRTTLETRPLSRWFEPSIEIGGPGGLRQYFERGGRGVRYVNLGDVSREGASGERSARIPMRGDHLEWDPQPTDLLVFPNPSIDGKRILVLAPHPDDAEIAAFGLYAFRDSSVITITAGNYTNRRYQHLYDDPRRAEIEQGRLRVWDSVTIPHWGGVPPSRSTNLGYFALTLERMQQEPDEIVSDESLETPDIDVFREMNVSTLLDDRPALSSWRNLVGDLTHALDTLRPDIIVSPHPVLDVASDHQLTTLALFEAMDRLHYDEASLFLYTNHLPAAEYYPFGPSESLVTLPPFFDDALPLGSVYSHALDEELQVKKLFALEAMHDLRSPPRREPGEHTRRILARARRKVREYWNDPHSYYSYYRRAVRPNELFFVYRATDRDAIRAYLSR